MNSPHNIMSRHEGVSCDSCMKGNFRGRRFKCLVCYDYDLCSNCFEGGVSTTRHTSSHPMQCILTRNDSDLYFGGDASLSSELVVSFTCPFCAKMGFTEATLQVNERHFNVSRVSPSALVLFVLECCFVIFAGLALR